MKRSVLLAILALLGGCATGAPTAESTDRAEGTNYARPFEHSGRMKDACMISRGYSVIYSTNAREWATWAASSS
jgi:hypothetical protein